MSVWLTTHEGFLGHPCFFCGEKVPSSNDFCGTRCLRQFLLGRREAFDGQELFSLLCSRRDSGHRTVVGKQRKEALQRLLLQGKEAGFEVDTRIYVSAMRWAPVHVLATCGDEFYAICMSERNFEANNVYRDSVERDRLNLLQTKDSFCTISILPSIILRNGALPVLGMLKDLQEGKKPRWKVSTSGGVKIGVWIPSIPGRWADIYASKEEVGEPLPLSKTLTKALQLQRE